MKWARLERFDPQPDGTPGRLRIFVGPDRESGVERKRLFTLEEEDQGNAENVSSIPLGSYVCERRFFNGGKYWTFHILDVPGRDLILFHKGNTEEDTAGCVLLGLELSAIMAKDEDGRGYIPKLAVKSSAPAFEQFMAAFEDVQRFPLEVVQL